MEKIKNFFSKSKNTILIGLVMCVVYFLYSIFFQAKYQNKIMFIFQNAYVIGLLIYFLTVFLRTKRKEINIKIIQKVLIGLFIFNAFICLLSFFTLGLYFVNRFITTIYFSVSAIYFYGIFNRKCKINNKVFFVISIINIIFYLYHCITMIYEFHILFIIDMLIYALFSLSIIPYFYNYYNLVKGCEK